MNKDFEVLPHTADIKIRVYGQTLQEFFHNALIGMFQVIGPQIVGCRIVNDRIVCNVLPERHNIQIESPDVEALLVDFLSEALYLSDVNNEAYLDVDFETISETKLVATLYGVKVQGFELVEIKAVTYNEMDVKKINGFWQTNIVFDI